MINYHTYHNSQLSILNSQLNKLQFTSSQDKHRRLWRPAVATHPPIAERQSAPCPEGTRIHQKPTASSEGAQLWDKQSSPPSLGSAKRDRLSSSTSYGKRLSPFGELYLGGGFARTHSCAASQLAVGFMI